MSLSDRLDSVRRAQQPIAPVQNNGQLRVLPAIVDPFAEVKARVHQAMIDQLGPKLYDPNLPAADLESRVRQTLQSIIDAEQTPLSMADRTRISQEVSDEILGHGPIEPLLRDPEITEIMVNGPSSIFVERAGKIFPVQASFASDAHLRRTIDKIVGRVGRRIDEASPLVDARLPGRIPRQRGDPADRSRRLGADDPEVLAGPVHRPRPPGLRHLLPAGPRASRRLRPRPPQHHHLRRYRLREDDDAERAVELHPVRRADHHHRGRGRAPAQPEACPAPRGAPVQHRGSRPGRDPRPGQERPPYASGPDRRR